MRPTRYDYIPYPWPVKPALLLLLGLAKDTSKQDYEARWHEVVSPDAIANWTGEPYTGGKVASGRATESV